MIEKNFIQNLNGVIKDIFIPQIYDDENSEYLTDNDVNIIGFVVQFDNNEEIKILLDKNEISTSLYIEDYINFNKYEVLYNYENYRKKLYEKIYLENSYLSQTEIKHLFYDTLISQEEFKIKPHVLYEYEINIDY